MRMFEASAYLRGSLGPDEGFWVFVPGLGVQKDGALEGRDAREGSSTDGFLGDPGEPTFDEVEPGGAGWCQMEVEPRVFSQPRPDDRMFVRAVVVTDQMDLPAPVLSVEDLQEGQELLVRVPAEASFGDRAGGHLQSSEQTRGAVPDVVMRHSGWKARTDRQDRLGPVQRLNLRLLVDAEHQCLLRRVQIEPDDVGHLPIKLRVRTELESFH